jgi:hypothetical protein
MPRGGLRPGAGRPRGSKGKKPDSEKKTKSGLTNSEAKEAKKLKMTPLEYMLKVINDDNAEKDRRDRMAIAAAQYVHSRASDQKGKKEERNERAKKAGSGKFARRPEPLRAVK